NFAVEYSIGQVDVSAPELVSATLTDLSHVQLVFNEPVDKSSAEDAENYEISNGVQVESASLQGDNKTMELVTTAHNYNTAYTVHVRNVADTAYDPNYSDTEKGYYLEKPDLESPIIESVNLVTLSLLEIKFSEPVLKASVEDTLNYIFSGGILRKSAELKNDGKTVLIHTSEHKRGFHYSVQVSNVADTSVNRNVIIPNSSMAYIWAIIETVPPVVNELRLLSNTELEVEFSEAIRTLTAETVANYSIDKGVSVISADLLADERTVKLVTTEPGESGIYELTIQNIEDMATPANKIAVTHETYTIVLPDTEAPFVKTLTKNSLTELVLEFSEKVNPLNAENIANYQIDNSTTVVSAKMSADSTQVTLTTAPHIRGTLYTLTMNNIVDVAEPANIIEPNTRWRYLFEIIDGNPPEVSSVTIFDKNTIEIVFNEPVDQVTAEKLANYNVTPTMPIVRAELQGNLKMVRLITAPHTRGRKYTISISGIRDRAVPVNTMATATIQYMLPILDPVKPELVNVDIMNEMLVDVYFSEPVLEQNAQDTLNYVVDKGIRVRSASVDPSNPRLIHLSTSLHERGQTYTLTVSNILDKADPANEIVPNSTSSYYFEIADNEKPEIRQVDIIEETLVQVMFTEPVNQTDAENITNYHIDNGVQISAANLQTDKMTVTLITSPHGRGVWHTITMNGIRDISANQNQITPNAAYRYALPEIDNIRPELYEAEIIDETTLNLTFTEPVEATSAETVMNYVIPGITVKAAHLQENGVTVVIKTSAHQRGKTYEMKISNVRDLAAQPNVIIANSVWVYLLELVDVTPPQIQSLLVHNPTEIELIFDETLWPESAENVSNYQISDGIEVTEAKLADNMQVVYLTTAEHTRGQLYRLTVSNIRDNSVNRNMMLSAVERTYMLEKYDITSPKLVEVILTGINRLSISFSEPLTPESALNVTNYTITNGVQVLGAKFIRNQHVIQLLTTDHQAGLHYDITVDNILDQSVPPNRIPFGSHVEYDCPEFDLVPPQILNVTMINPGMLTVEFSEQVATEEAENIGNYEISDGIAVLEADLAPDRVSVTLTTSEHEEEGRYVLTINNVHDLAQYPNAIPENSSYLYTFHSNQILKNVSLIHYVADSLEVGDEYFIDRAYKLTDLPKNKTGLLWLKTANTDRYRTDESFLSFSIEEKVKLYVAYDSRGVSVPDWLVEQFTKTGTRIGVSDLSHDYVIWERIAEPGDVYLGANLAAGAEGAKAMYMVLIEQILESDDEPGGGEVKPIPVTFELYQNTPNPFNAQTKIIYDVREKSRVQMKIFNILGRQVIELVDDFVEAGAYEVIWNGRNQYDMSVATGIYLCAMIVTPYDPAEGQDRNTRVYKSVRKMMLIK
ncbi:hypothetical protein KAH55_08040, partial [bacterium]|nr:hypothetical protein [bacterium]